ncbi:MAG: hypothetical protein Q8K65_02070 [Alphaproteobacteria bacterium]|nr:hypothetical protein [Alphaproteobacteria bacterium]
MSNSVSETTPSTAALRPSFDMAATAAQPFNLRWTAYREIAKTGGADAPALLAEALASEKDSGIRYMTAGLLRDVGSQTPATATIAAQAIAGALGSEKDAYARRSMELALAELAAAQPQTTAIAAAAIASGLKTSADTLTRCLQAGQLTDFCAAVPATGAQILPAVAAAFTAEKDKLAAHHLSRTLVTIAADSTQRQHVIATLMHALTTAPSQENPVEKTFAAAHALHRIAEQSPQSVSFALAFALGKPGQGDNARRLCILGLGAFAQTDKDCAKIAAKALFKALPGETEPLNRRHIVEGIMNAVHSGLSSQSAGSGLYAHLNARERDRETRDNITRALRSLGHKTPAVPMSIPGPKL